MAMMPFSVGGDKSKSSANSYVWSGQSPYLTDMYGRAQNLSYGDPINQTQQRGYDMALGFANNGARNIFGQSMGAFNTGLNAADVNNNPYLDSAMNAAIRPLTQQYTEQVLPGIRNSSIGAGSLGSSRQGIAEGIASRGYMDAVGGVTANMGNSAYNQGLNTMTQTLGYAPSMMNLGMTPSGIYQDVGTQMQNAPWQQLGNYAGLLGDPTVLQQSKTKSSGFNFGLG